MIRRLKFGKHKAAWVALGLCVTIFSIIFAYTTTAARRSSEVVAAEKITVPGVSNVARVSSTLYRGGQPSPWAFGELKKLGIDIVVDLRNNREDIRAEKERVDAQGLTFVSIPWNAEMNPSRENVIAFFTTLRDNPGKKIFVHCQRGADRTGVMIALYRIVYDHWTTNQAVAEMTAFHYWNHLLPHLARYVEAFPTTLISDPSIIGQPVQATVPH
jgi:protein tyrosine/serine phosphatase